MDTFTALKTRLAQISDLRRAASLISWDQHVMMPAAATDGRAEQLATLDRLAHELFVAEETGRLLEGSRSYAESLDPDSDDASPRPRDAPRLREGEPRPRRPARRADARRGAGVQRVAGGEGALGLRALPPGARAQRRAQAPLHRLLRPHRRALRHPPRRLRARDDDGRGARDLRRPEGRARAARARDRRPRRPLARGRPRGRLRRGDAAGALPRDRRPLRLPAGHVAARPDRPPVRLRRRRRRHPAHDLLRPRQPRLDLRDHARVRPRALRAPGRPGARAHSALLRRRRSACTSRRAACGRTSSAAASRSGAASTGACRSFSRRRSAVSSSSAGTRRSTACIRR